MGNKKKKKKMPNFLPHIGIHIGLHSGRPYQGRLLCHRFYYLQGECYSFLLLMQIQIILLHFKFFLILPIVFLMTFCSHSLGATGSCLLVENASFFFFLK